MNAEASHMIGQETLAVDEIQNALAVKRGD